MATFDHHFTNALCVMFERSGIFDRFTELCRTFALQPPSARPRLTKSKLAETLARHITPVKSTPKFPVVHVGHEIFGDWTWFGAVVIQYGSVLEVMFEGSNGSFTAGSSLHDLRNTALRLRDAAGAGPPYLRPDYDGDDLRLDRLARSIADLVNAMKDVLRTAPLPS